MWSVTRRPSVLNLVSAVSVATFGAMCRRECVHVKIGGLRRTCGAIELRARVIRSRRLHDGQCRDEDTAKRHLAQLPGRLQHHAECVVAMAQPIAPPAFAWSLTRTFQPPPASLTKYTGHQLPCCVVVFAGCWPWARLGRGKKISGGPPALFSYLTQGRRFAYLESSRSSPWHSTMGWPNP